MSLTRAETLYDAETLQRLYEQYGHEAAIKRNVDTDAFVYEIRTAINYWGYGNRSHRTSDRVWDVCREVDDGEYEVVDGELVDGNGEVIHR